MLFKLNLSSSDPVKVTVSFVQHSVTGTTKVSIFEQQGSSFDQKVSISGRGTYHVDITNENPFPVTLDGNVLVQQRETNYRTIYPYIIPGFIIMLGGSSLLIYGTLKKTKKPSKSKRLSKEKIKSK